MELRCEGGELFCSLTASCGGLRGSVLLANYCNAEMQNCLYVCLCHFKRYAYVSLNKSKRTLLYLGYGPSLALPLQ